MHAQHVLDVAHAEAALPQQSSRRFQGLAELPQDVGQYLSKEVELIPAHKGPDLDEAELVGAGVDFARNGTDDWHRREWWTGRTDFF